MDSKKFKIIVITMKCIILNNINFKIMLKHSKKLIAISLLVMISVSTLSAQTKEKKNTFGIIAGGVVSTISDYEGSTRLGLTGGLYWEYRLSEKFSLMSNILYSQRGENGKDNLSEIKLSYINMPLMVKYKLFDNFGIATGINSDMLLSVEGSGLEKDDFKKSDWSIPIGISYDICENLQAGMIYNIGLTNINNSDNELENNWGNITLTYLFKKKKK
jgi:hypothetical protein